jgi:hypothetical protein
VEPDHADYLKGVAGVAPDDLWAVGFTRLPSFRTAPLLEHWDGNRWSKVPIEPPPGSEYGGLEAITAIAADDMWAVGRGDDGAVAYHFDGKKWTPHTKWKHQDGRYLSIFRAVAAVATDDVWAVGAGEGGPIMVHWDGHAWTIVPPHSGRQDWGVDSLFGVAATGADDVWAAGGYSETSTYQHNRLMHWDGQRWHRVKVRDFGDDENTLNGIDANGPDDIWAVGDFTMETDGQHASHRLLLHYDGDRWTRVRM